MANKQDSILTAVKNVLTTAVSPINVVRRKTLKKRVTDTLPMVIVCGGDISRNDYDSEANVYKAYEVKVYLLRAGNAIQIGNLQSQDTQELIEKALDMPSLSGVTEVYDSVLHPGVTYDEGQIDANVEYTEINIIYFTYEPRN